MIVNKVISLKEVKDADWNLTRALSLSQLVRECRKKDPRTAMIPPLEVAYFSDEDREVILDCAQTLADHAAQRAEEKLEALGVTID